ncbi:hypothetical protein Tco_0793185 [Tanacetum coccineum]
MKSHAPDYLSAAIFWGCDRLVSEPDYRELVAPAVSVSADSPKESFGDTIKIGVDVVHPVPITSTVFLASTVVMRLAEHGEAVQDVAEAKRATLRATIRSMGVVEASLRNRVRDEREARARLERQLGWVQEELESLRRSRFP